MNAFTDIVFIFVFVFVILHFGLIDITSTNVVVQKIYMFIAITVFATLLSLMKSIRNKTPIRMWHSIINGLIIGILAFIGHTFMFDLWYMPETNGWLSSIVDGHYITLNILMALFISLTIMIGKSAAFIFSTELCD